MNGKVNELQFKECLYNYVQDIRYSEVKVTCFALFSHRDEKFTVFWLSDKEVWGYRRTPGNFGAKGLKIKTIQTENIKY